MSLDIYDYEKDRLVHSIGINKTKEIIKMKSVTNAELSASKVQVELSSHVLKELLKSGLLHGEDCKCLNANAKQVIWQALLATSTDDNRGYLCA